MVLDNLGRCFGGGCGWFSLRLVAMFGGFKLKEMEVSDGLACLG